MSGSGSHPYFHFGIEHRYPYNWHGGAGGVPWSRVAAESRGLGIFDMAESGLEAHYERKAFPAFRRTGLHRPSDLVPGLSDWPLVRPAGPEPLDPHHATLSDIPIWSGLSDMEKVAAVAVAGGIAFWWMKRGRKRRARR